MIPDAVNPEDLPDIASRALAERTEEQALPLLEKGARAARTDARLWQWLALLYRALDQHEVEEVKSGERLVAITFIQSQVKDPFRRNLLFDLNEVAALEGLSMKPENFSRLQLVQANLLRYWADKP